MVLSGQFAAIVGKGGAEPWIHTDKCDLLRLTNRTERTRPSPCSTQIAPSSSILEPLADGLSLITSHTGKRSLLQSEILRITSKFGGLSAPFLSNKFCIKVLE